MLVDSLLALQNQEDMTSSEILRAKDGVYIAQSLSKDDRPFYVHLYSTVLCWLFIGSLMASLFNESYNSYLKKKDEQSLILSDEKAGTSTKG